MDKTLVISYTLPPSPSGSATVIANLCRQFSKNDLVITGAKNLGVETVFDWDDAPIIEYTSWRTKPFKGAGIIRLMMLPLTLVLTCFYFYKYKCKNIIAVYPNNEFLILGYLVAKITGSSFYPYMHNTFADGKERKGLSKTFFDVTEKLIFNEAKEVLLLSDGLKIFYSKKYGKVFNYKIIRHSFNENIDKEFKHIHDKGKSKYVMLGSINESNRDATVRLFSIIHKIDNTELVLRSGTPQSQLNQMGILDLCTIIPELNRAQLFDMLNSAHALLLPHGFIGKISSAEYQTIFPTKTIEYLLSGRPIIAHCSNNSFLHDFLTEYNCAYIITETDTEIVKRKIIEFSSDDELHKKLVNNALIAAKIFDANVVSKALRNALGSNLN